MRRLPAEIDAREIVRELFCDGTVDGRPQLTTVTVIVPTGFLALTRTPSIAPSRSDVTLPTSAGGAICASAGIADMHRHAAKAAAGTRAMSRVDMACS